MTTDAWVIHGRGPAAAEDNRTHIERLNPGDNPADTHVLPRDEAPLVVEDEQPESSSEPVCPVAECKPVENEDEPAERPKRRFW